MYRRGALAQPGSSSKFTGNGLWTGLRMRKSLLVRECTRDSKQRLEQHRENMEAYIWDINKRRNAPCTFLPLRNYFLLASNLYSSHHPPTPASFWFQVLPIIVDSHLLEICYSKCSITWELVRNVDFSVSPQTCIRIILARSVMLHIKVWEVLIIRLALGGGLTTCPIT